jgi:polyisoprenoid-binding protein YceI
VIGVASINSHDVDRDAYLRSAAVLDVQRYAIASYRDLHGKD